MYPASSLIPLKPGERVKTDSALRAPNDSVPLLSSPAAATRSARSGRSISATLTTTYRNHSAWTSFWRGCERHCATLDLEHIPTTRSKVMLNFANQPHPSACGGFPPTVWASRAWNLWSATKSRCNARLLPLRNRIVYPLAHDACRRHPVARNP